MPLDAGMWRFDANTAAAGDFSSYRTTLTMYPTGDVGIGGNLHVPGQLRWGNSVANPDSIELGAPDGSVPGMATPFIDFHFRNLAQDYNTRIINDADRRLSIVGNLNVTGGATKLGGGSWTAASDVRLKKGVESLKDALGKILRLRGVSFEWKDPQEQGNLTGEQMGLVAQEVEEVFPQWISTDPDGYKNMTVRGFEALAVEAFKQLKADNESLNAWCEL